MFAIQQMNLVFQSGFLQLIQWCLTAMKRYQQPAKFRVISLLAKQEELTVTY